MTTIPDTPPPILVLADLHGHADWFEEALDRGRELAGRPDVTVVTLGDYCDNGPQIPRLLDRLASFAADHPGGFHPILGNHDLACLLTLGWPTLAEGNPTWWDRWQWRYPNGILNWTPSQYEATSLEDFRRNFPPLHLDFLSGLPWSVRLPGYVFVHAGMALGALAPQEADLERRDMSPYAVGHQPPALRDDGRARVFDPSWDAIVISGHTKHANRKDFLAPNRLTLHAAACLDQPLHAALLPAEPRPSGAPEGIFFQVGGRR